MRHLVDTHCHLDLLQDKAGLKDWTATCAYVDPMPERMVHVACHASEFARGIAFLDQPEVYGAFGVHPHEASEYCTEVEVELRQCLAHPKALAAGEMGLDYHYDLSPRDIQREAFRKQLALALELGKPIVLHTREADDDTLSILREFPLGKSRIHVHCYTGNLEFANALLALDAEVYFGFTGILTFKTAEEIRAVAASVPENRLLVETDSPFLAPVPFRGKTAHPGMVGWVLDALAKARNMAAEQLEETVRENVKRFYGI